MMLHSAATGGRQPFSGRFATYRPSLIGNCCRRHPYISSSATVASAYLHFWVEGQNHLRI